MRWWQWEKPKQEKAEKDSGGRGDVGVRDNTVAGGGIKRMQTKGSSKGWGTGNTKGRERRKWQ